MSVPKKRNRTWRWWSFLSVHHACTLASLPQQNQARTNRGHLESQSDPAAASNPPAAASAHTMRSSWIHLCLGFKPLNLRFQRKKLGVLNWNQRSRCCCSCSSSPPGPGQLPHQGFRMQMWKRGRSNASQHAEDDRRCVMRACDERRSVWNQHISWFSFVFGSRSPSFSCSCFRGLTDVQLSSETSSANSSFLPVRRCFR